MTSNSLEKQRIAWLATKEALQSMLAANHLSRGLAAEFMKQQHPIQSIVDWRIIRFSCGRRTGMTTAAVELAKSITHGDFLYVAPTKAPPEVPQDSIVRYTNNYSPLISRLRGSQIPDMIILDHFHHFNFESDSFQEVLHVLSTGLTPEHPFVLVVLG